MVGVYGHVGSLLGQRQRLLHASSLFGTSAACPLSVFLYCIPIATAFGWLKESHLRLELLLRASERLRVDLMAFIVFRTAFTHFGVWVYDPRCIARCLGYGISGGYEAFGLGSPHECVLRFLRTTVGSIFGWALVARLESRRRRRGMLPG